MSDDKMIKNLTNDEDDQESQTIEWKWSWQDEYLKWLCGYANTKGGTLYIGINDDGYVVGVKNAKQMLESLPNTVTSKIGILASVEPHRAYGAENIRYGNAIPDGVAEKLVNQYACGRLSTKEMDTSDKRYRGLLELEKENKIWEADDGTREYISITVEEYPFAVSCDGKYYKRSGSTLHTLNGLELQNFLFAKAGKTWDAAPMPSVKISDLSEEAIDAFRKKAVKKNRMTAEQAAAPVEVLLDDLKLLENEMLTRAAVMMFHPDPEKFVTGAYIKVAYFAPAGAYGQNKVDDIIYSDDIHGPLMTQVDEAIKIIYRKYLKALISYDGLQRIETFLWPLEGFREILLNAVNHKAYETGIPIQIRVYDDKITVWNDGQWPRKIDVNKIYERHPSVPYNPKMADVFYRSGEIESWGSGFEKIQLECNKANAPYPIINANPEGGVELECDGCDLYMKLLRYGRYYDTYPQEIVNGDGAGEKKISEAESPHVSSASILSEKEQKSVDRMMEILSRKLSDKEKERILPIVNHLKMHNTITRRQAEKLTGKALSTVTRYLHRLEELGVIAEEGKSVSTLYRRI